MLPRLQSPFCGTAYKSLKVDLIANYDVISKNTAFWWSQMKSEPSKTLGCMEFLFLYDAVIEIKFRQCLPKVLEHLCKFCLVVRFPPLPLRTMLCCGQKIGMIGRSATLLECWDNNLRNQHCFGGEGVFEPDGYG